MSIKDLILKMKSNIPGHEVVGIIAIIILSPILLLLIIVILPVNWFQNKFRPLKLSSQEVVTGLRILKDEKHPYFDHYLDGFFSGRIEDAKLDKIVRDVFSQIDPTEEYIISSDNIKLIDSYISEIEKDTISDLRSNIIESQKKYKLIKSCIHNAAHSFLSLMNYFDDEYIIDIIPRLLNSSGNKEISINLTTGKIDGISDIPNKLRASVEYHRDYLPKHILSHQLDPNLIRDLTLRIFPSGPISKTANYGIECDVECLDDRGVKHTKRVMLNS